MRILFAPPVICLLFFLLLTLFQSVNLGFRDATNKCFDKDPMRLFFNYSMIVICQTIHMFSKTICATSWRNK